jgi:hypothetical protein
MYRYPYIKTVTWTLVTTTTLAVAGPAYDDCNKKCERMDKDAHILEGNSYGLVGNSFAASSS